MISRRERLLHDSLIAAAESDADRNAIADEFVVRTYGQLAERALRVARLLRAEGLRRGDRVALQLDNTTECAAAVLGAWMADGAVTVVNPQLRPDKLAYVLSHSDASVLIVEGHLGSVAEAAVAKSRTKRVFATAAPGRETPFQSLENAIEASDTGAINPRIIGPDLALLVYTSGTTGHPKGVMLSHQGLAFTADSVAEYLRLDASDRILNVLPFAFTYGLSQLFLTVRVRATLLLERSFAFPGRTLERMRNEKATVFPAVPTIYATLAGMEHKAPYESLRCVTNAAAGLPPALHDSIRRIFPNADLYRMYGQTECVRASYLEPKLVDEKPTSVGRAIPGTEAFVLRPDGSVIEPGETGILHVRGPNVMMGYWRDPEATERTLKPGIYPNERVLCTHDHFTVDEDGLLYFIGRTDDIIKTRGEKVSTVEVENALHAIDGVRQAAVIGVPDDVLGHAIRAYVVLEDYASLTGVDIRRLARTKLESFMVPTEVVLLEELPHTPSGKVEKRSLIGDAHESVLRAVPDPTP